MFLCFFVYSSFLFGSPSACDVSERLSLVVSALEVAAGGAAFAAAAAAVEGFMSAALLCGVCSCPSHPNIFAAGDIASFPYVKTG